ncbi:MAG: hypothetical protein ABIZ80_10380 [Bryobacteraceae bacterium]
MAKLLDHSHGQSGQDGARELIVERTVPGWKRPIAWAVLVAASAG